MSAYDYITETGTIVPDAAQIQQNLTLEYQGQFGANINLSPSTPQGALYNSELISRLGIARNNAQLANQINPNLATGVYLDALLYLTGAFRLAGTYTFVNCDLTGVPGTIIPAGSKASNVNGFIFELETEVTLDGSGNGIGIFRSVVVGAIACNANTLNQIVNNNITGWETINNPSDGIIGTPQQTNEQARVFRLETLASNGYSESLSISSALYNVTGVRSLRYLENETSSNVVKEGIAMVPHSIYVCVDGGLDNDIAYAILSKKSSGSDYNGNITVPVIDPTSGQLFPVKFSRPTEVNILVEITISASSTVSNVVSSVKSAIIDYANGLVNGESGFVVSANVSPFEIAGAVNCIYPNIFVRKCEVSKDIPLDFKPEEIEIQTDEVARITESDIFVILQ